MAGAVLGSTPLGRDLPDVLRILADLPEPTASSAFARTLRAVVDWRGQVVTMLDRCYLTESVPVQLIWGSRDSVIPVSHADMAHSAMPGSQLEIFEGSGHFPFHDDPDRFVEVVERFIDSTEPAHYDQEQLRNLLRTGISESGDHRIGRHPSRGARRDGRRRAQRHLTVAVASPRSIGLMAIDVTVLRVFTDPDGKFGNPLGVVDASTVEPSDRQRIATQLGYSETIFIDVPEQGASTASARIFTPATELPFAGHPTVGASWWLRDRGTPVNTLQVPAGIVQITYEDDLTAVSARSEWAPEFAIYDLESTEELFGADPDDYPDDIAELPVDVDRQRSGRAALPDVRGQPGGARGRGDRSGRGADHRLPQPRPDHRAGQGVGDPDPVEPRRLGPGRRPRGERRNQADRLTAACGSALRGNLAVRAQRLDLALEILGRRERPVDGGEPQIGHLVEFAQRAQDRQPDLVAGHLG